MYGDDLDGDDDDSDSEPVDAVENRGRERTKKTKKDKKDKKEDTDDEDDEEDVCTLGKEGTIAFATLRDRRTDLSYLIMKGRDIHCLEFPTVNRRCPSDTFQKLFAALSGSASQEDSNKIGSGSNAPIQPTKSHGVIGKVGATVVQHMAFKGKLPKRDRVELAFLCCEGFVLVPLDGSKAATKSYLRATFFSDAGGQAYKVIDSILCDGKARFFKYSPVDSLLPSSTSSSSSSSSSRSRARSGKRK